MTPAAVVTELRALAGSLRAGTSLRRAVAEWHELMDPSRPHLRAVAVRLRLGAEIPAALRGLEPVYGAGAGRLAALFDLGSTWGGDVGAMVDGLAASIERRAAGAHAARAACAGALLSARLVAALPLLLVPLTGLPEGDGPGLALFGAGVALAAAGIRWMGRLVPSPRASDEIAEVAGLTAILTAGGVPLGPALGAAAALAPGSAPDLARPLVALGASWSRALSAAGPDASDLERLIGRAERSGGAVASDLSALAAQRRAAAAREVEARLRRAPVLMALPLTVCVLPSFVLLGLGPFLRGLARLL